MKQRGRGRNMGGVKLWERDESNGSIGVRGEVKEEKRKGEEEKGPQVRDVAWDIASLEEESDAWCGALRMYFGDDGAGGMCTAWTSRAVTSVVRMVGERGGAERALALLRWLCERERDSPSTSSSSMASSCSRARTPHSLTAVVDVAVADRKLQLAERAIDEMLSQFGVRPSVVTFNAVLKGYAMRGDEANAIRVVQVMTTKEVGVRPDTVTFNLLLRACGHNSGGFARLRRIYGELKRSGAGVSERTVVTLFSAVTMQLERGHLDGFNDQQERFLLDVLKDCELHGVPINSHVVSAVAPIFPMTARRLLMDWNASSSFFSGEPNLVAYTNTIHALTSTRRAQEALDVFKLMRARKVEPNLYCLSAVISACRKTGDIELALESFNRLRHARFSAKAVEGLGSRRMRQEWSEDRILTSSSSSSSTNSSSSSAPSRGRRRQRDVDDGSLLVVYNSLLALCVSCGVEHHERCLEIFRAMQREPDIRVDTVSYNSVLSSCERSGDVETCFRLYSQLREENVKPDGITFTVLLSTCAKHKRLHEARDIIIEMQKIEAKGYVSVSQSLSMLIDTCVERCVSDGGGADAVEPRATRRSIGHGRAALSYRQLLYSFMEGMLTLRIQPTMHAYMSLMRLFAHEGDVARAQSLFRRMYSTNTEPNDACHRYMLQACSKARNLHAMMTIFKEMIRRHMRFDITTTRALFAALCAPGRSDAVDGTDRSDDEHGIDHFDDELDNRALQIEQRQQEERARDTIATDDDELALPKKDEDSADTTDRSLDRALRVLSLLRSSQPDGGEAALDAEVLSALITALSLRGRAIDALAVFKDAIASSRRVHVRVSDEAFSRLISILCRSRLLNDALEVYECVGMPAPILVPTLSVRHGTESDNDAYGGVDDPSAWYPRADSHAICDLIHAFARNGDVQRAMALYMVLESLPDAQTAMRACPYIFEALIEECCRNDLDLELALDVYDDMRDAGALISVATLAFLLQACKLKAGIDLESQKAFEWRVYDVASAIRSVKEQEKKERVLGISLPSSSSSTMSFPIPSGGSATQAPCHHMTTETTTASSSSPPLAALPVSHADHDDDFVASSSSSSHRNHQHVREWIMGGDSP